jgi:Zn-dependent peptidase ImmA (M78 family)
MNKLEISSTVKDYLKKFNLDSYPVSVENVAIKLGIIIFKELLPEDISGILDLRTKPVIMINATHYPNRQRFSIAHEIGHFLLHRPTGSIHIDKQTFYRNTKSAEGLDEVEIQANNFAAELLMPTDLLTTELNKYSDLIDSNDDVVLELAKKFEVSTTAMGFRLQNLGYSF